MDLQLHDHVALITGANRGTGSAIAQTLAREGTTVIVHGPGPDDGQAALCEHIAARGGRALPVFGDLSTDAGADQLQKQVSDLALSVSILVNNLGAAAGGTWSDATTADWVTIYEQNVLSTVRMVQRFVPDMRARGFGRVIQLATIGVISPNARMPHYYASKGAMASLTVSLAKELAASGITVNTVSPGLIHTAEVEARFVRSASKRGWGDDWNEIERRAVAEFMPNPCGRMARREEVADLVAFLASPRAGYINGTQLRIDGGATGTVY